MLSLNAHNKYAKKRVFEIRFAAVFILLSILYAGQLRAENIFTIVNQQFNSSSINLGNHSQKALYTQIAGKPFNVKLLSLDPSGGFIKRLVDFQNGSNFEIQVINTPNTASCNGDETCKQNVCKEASLVQKVFEGKVDFVSNGIAKIDNIFVSNALKAASFKIISKDANKTYCSADSFSVRPKEFTMSENISEKLIGGVEYQNRLEAIDFNGDLLQSYNQAANTLKHNSTLILPPNCTGLNGNTQKEFHLTNGDFLNGKSDVKIKYDNVGDARAIFLDKDWTLADKDFGDCVENNSNTHDISGKVGCYISSNKTISFKPKEFQNELKISNYNNGKFTYISNEPDMSANMLLTFKAILGNGKTATNYHAKCYAKDIGYSLDLIKDPVGFENTIEPSADKQLIFHKNVSDDSKPMIFNANSGDFKMGEANVNIKFGFKRRADKTQNPFKVSNADFNITAVADEDNVGGFDFANRNVATEATFFYGRVKSSKPIYGGHSQIPVKINYEVFCGVGCDALSYNISLASKSGQGGGWYVNDKHTKEFGRIKRFKAAGSSKARFYTTLNINNGSEENTFGNALAPYKDTINMETSPWLLYDKNKKSPLYESFELRFESLKEVLTNESENKENEKASMQGRVLNISASSRMRQRMAW